MKAGKLLEMKLKDILEKYCIVFSAECDYLYGITTDKAIDEIAEKWDICEEPSFEVAPLIRLEILCEIEDNEKVLTFDDLDRLISNNLPIELKGDSKQ